MTKLSCYPLIGDDGNRIFVTQESGEYLFNLLLPTSDKVEIHNQSDSVKDAIKRLEQYKQTHGLA